MTRRTLLAVGLVLVTLGAVCPVAWAMYRWVDEDGDVHISSRLEDVPEKYRGRAASVTAPGPSVHESCASFPGDPKGGARVKFERKHFEQILVNVCVNGRGPFRMLIDTGAPGTIVSTEVFERLGVDLSHQPKGAISGIGGGVGLVRLVMVRSLQIGGAKVGPLRVKVYDATPEDGAIGQDFMSKFIMEVDNERKVLTLTPR